MNSPVDIGDISPRRYFATVAVVLGLLFAFIEGDDESGLEVLLSLLQWQLQSALPMLLLLLSHMALSRLPLFEGQRPWHQLIVSGLCGSLLFAPFALLIDIVLGGSERFSLGELADEFFAVAPPVSLSWLAMNAPFVLGLRLRSSHAAALDGLGGSRAGVGTVESAVGAEPRAEPGFMRLVPKALRGELLYVKAELHYLAVVTTAGRSLVLYNLRDAIDELASTPGRQVHRSFWVALSQVDSLWRKGRQGVLLMKNHDRVPVSRRRLAEIEALLSVAESANEEGSEGRKSASGSNF